MPRLTSTEEFVLTTFEDNTYGIARTTQSRWGVTVIERAVKLEGGDLMDTITVVKSLNETVATKKKRKR